jgi:hypothetical protein
MEFVVATKFMQDLAFGLSAAVFIIATMGFFAIFFSGHMSSTR